MLPDRVIRIDPPRVETDTWRFLEEVPEALPRGAIAVPLAAWAARREELLARPEPTGVWLGPNDDPETLGRDLFAVSIVGVQFPKSADGRGYSTAVVLRRLGYRGELRAFGDLGRDHLVFLKRCGFDAFSLAPHHDPEAALAAFGEFSLRYQAAIDDPVPLFRRRTEGSRA